MAEKYHRLAIRALAAWRAAQRANNSQLVECERLSYEMRARVLVQDLGPTAAAALLQWASAD